jgi:hypothetical protein
VISGELNGDTSGVSILKSALGERKEAVAHALRGGKVLLDVAGSSA